MKKLITLLGAITLSASSATAVVACSSDSIDAYTNFAKFADATRPTFDENGNTVKAGSTLVYYLGAEDNLSSLSFEYAIKVASGVGKEASMSEAFNKINNVSSSNNTFIDDFKQIGKTLKTNNEFASDNEFVQTEVKYSKKDKLWYFKSQSKNGFTFSNDATSEKIELQGSTVETVGDLWTNKATKKILTDWIEPSIARMVYSNTQETSWDKTKDKIEIKTLNEQIEARTNAIKSSKGPLFLIVRNGEFIGYFEGFNVYNEVFKSGEDNSSLKTKKYEEKELINNFNKGISSIINTKDIVSKTYETTNTNYKLSNDAWKWELWDNWVTKDSSSSGEQTPDPDPELLEEEDPSQDSYTYNLNKY